MKLKFILLPLLLFVFGNAYSQKVTIKDDIIYIDDSIFLKSKTSRGGVEFSVLDANSGNELIFMKRYDNETQGYTQDDYLAIHFIEFKLKLETKNLRMWKNTISWMLENGIFEENGSLNREKVENFVEKYNENITDRTIRW
jgi:hypothetical protein